MPGTEESDLLRASPYNREVLGSSTVIGPRIEDVDFLTIPTKAQRTLSKHIHITTSSAIL